MRKKTENGRKKSTGQVSQPISSANSSESSSNGYSPLCNAIRKCEKSIKNMLSDEISLDAYFDKNLKNYVPSNETANAWADNENKSKNRSKIPCYDHSRVKLEIKNDRKSDYINANFVEFPEIGRKYIMTQYPLPETMEDFWTMVFENNVEVLISIFKPAGDPDIEEYSPEVVSPNQSGQLTLRENLFRMTKSHVFIAKRSQRLPLVDAKSYFPLLEGQYMTIGRFFVHTRKFEPRKKWYTADAYTVEILPEGCSECKFVKVFNYPKWSKNSMPSSFNSIAMFIRSIDVDPLRKGPIVIHCDTGIDRSATVVMADVIVQKVFSEKTVDIEEIFTKIRKQRGGSFQSSQYFSFAIISAISYITRRCKAKANLDKDTMKLLEKLLLSLNKTHI